MLPPGLLTLLVAIPLLVPIFAADGNGNNNGDGNGNGARVNQGQSGAFARSLCIPGAYFGQTVFEPLKVQCPLANTSHFITLQFETGLTDSNATHTNSGLFWSVAASHGPNKTLPLGFQMELRTLIATSATSEPTYQDLDTTNTTWKCSSALAAERKLCLTAQFQFDAVTAVTASILLTNTGDCQEDIYLETALDDLGAFDNRGTSSCLQAMQLLQTDIPLPQPTLPPTPEPTPFHPVVVFSLEFALEKGTARPPTQAEVNSLLCRTDRFFQAVMQNRTRDIAVQSYSTFLASQYRDPNSTFPINITFVSNTTNTTDGTPIDANAIIDDYMYLPIEQVVYYIENYVWDTSNDDVFSNTIGVSFTSHSRATIDELSAPWTPTCPSLSDPLPKPNQVIPTDPICTLRPDAANKPLKYFRPIQMPCPNVGDRIVASFTHSLPSIPSSQVQDPYIQVLATAAYGRNLNETVGLLVMVESRDIPATPDATCPAALTAVTGFGQGFQIANISFDPQAEAIEKEVTVMVWNELALGCNVNETLQLEVSLAHPDSFYDITDSWALADCTEDLRMDNRCEVPTSPLEEDGICNLTKGSDDLGRDQTARIYPTLEIECPEEGKKAIVDLAFFLPNQAHRQETMVRLSLAVAHGASFDQTEGLLLEAFEGTGNCDWSPEFQSGLNTVCPDWLLDSGSSAKLCSSFTPSGSPGSMIHYTIAVWNLGGCEGSLRIEASIDDRGVTYENPSKCAAAPDKVPCEVFGPNRGSSSNGLDLSLGGGVNDGGASDQQPGRGNFTLSLGSNPGQAGSADDSQSFSEGGAVSGGDEDGGSSESDGGSSTSDGGSSTSDGGAGNEHSSPSENGGQPDGSPSNGQSTLGQGGSVASSDGTLSDGGGEGSSGGGNAFETGGGNAFEGQGSGSRSFLAWRAVILAGAAVSVVFL